MNPQPNFEQYKTDQAKIEKIPTIKPEFHFVINDIAKKVLDNQEISQKEIGDLEMVYDMTQDLEKELATFLDVYRSKNTISKTEFLIVIDYFLTANQNGPDSKEIKDILSIGDIPTEEFESVLINTQVPSNTQKVIYAVYNKILLAKQNSML